MGMPDMTSLNVSTEHDKDMFNDDISEIFQDPYHLAHHVAVGLDSTYILYLSNNSSLIGAALSNGTVTIYDSLDLTKKNNFKVHDEMITGLKFSPGDENLIYTSSLDYTVKLWDIRTEKNVRTFLDTSVNANDGRKKPLTSFDINSSDRFLAAGTEQVVGEAFLLFWDARQEKLLGGYWDSHQDDVTTLRFHPDKPDILSSGSTDGIVNIYDISENCEDDALSTSINTESSIQKLTWVNSDELGILTHTEEIKLWRIEDFGPYREFIRNDVTVGLKRNVTELSYVVDIHGFKDRIVVLAGSSCTNNPCLRLTTVRKSRLKPVANLSSPRVRSLLVRSSVLNPDDGTLFTGGEDGILCCWKPGVAQDDKEKNHSAKAEKAAKSKTKKKNNPY